MLYVGDPEAGASAVQPIKDLVPAVDHIGPMPYTAFQAALDLLSPYSGDEQMIVASRAFAAAMRPFSAGAAYLNFTHEADRVRDAYGDGQYARLVALKDTYDPANLFRLNQNIRPSHPAPEAVYV